MTSPMCDENDLFRLLKKSIREITDLPPDMKKVNSTLLSDIVLEPIEIDHRNDTGSSVVTANEMKEIQRSENQQCKIVTFEYPQYNHHDFFFQKLDPKQIQEIQMESQNSKLPTLIGKVRTKEMTFWIDRVTFTKSEIEDDTDTQIGPFKSTNLTSTPIIDVMQVLMKMWNEKNNDSAKPAFKEFKFRPCTKNGEPESDFEVLNETTPISKLKSSSYLVSLDTTFKQEFATETESETSEMIEDLSGDDDSGTDSEYWLPSRARQYENFTEIYYITRKAIKTKYQECILGIDNRSITIDFLKNKKGNLSINLSDVVSCQETDNKDLKKKKMSPFKLTYDNKILAFAARQHTTRKIINKIEFLLRNDIQ
eukprot:TRINITY_DN4672_c0_g1_i1.p1 TRINITY_DN4672_c0_g1~~TRINITY_DN4672_c0_g1_i1.p1  ORF type:complete len:367 (+),score=72.78 TRINITY_DN4672_c0_g1_i1:31-1131(+)